ncbi:Protein of unknown function (DUF3421) [Popillia japonica]|uniref:Uncharacterized protein n=1 Tax=Popillia japonica TaxID=7064 RepID=A0AAW1K316_POPJA
MADCKFKGCASEEFYWRNYFPSEIPCDAFPGPDFCIYPQCNKAVGERAGKQEFRENIRVNIQFVQTVALRQCNKAVGERAGKQEFRENIRIMCTTNAHKFFWEPIDFNCVTDCQMKNAVVGGYQDGYNLYVGKAYHEGEWKIGKVVPKHNPYKGLQVWNRCGSCEIISSFDILKCTPTC